MAGGGGGMGGQTPPGFNQPQPMGGSQPPQPMLGAGQMQPIQQQMQQIPSGPINTVPNSRIQQYNPRPGPSLVQNFLQKQKNFMQQRFGQQGGMNQSPQMGGFNGGMGVGSSPYSPMGGGYGMSGANPQLDGMGAFGGGQGPQMGGFTQTSPMGGMGQAGMGGGQPIGGYGGGFGGGFNQPPQMGGFGGMDQASMGGMRPQLSNEQNQSRMNHPAFQGLPAQPIGNMSGAIDGDDFVNRRTPEQLAQNQAQMNSMGAGGIMNLMRNRFGQQGKM